MYTYVKMWDQMAEGDKQTWPYSGTHLHSANQRRWGGYGEPGEQAYMY